MGGNNKTLAAFYPGGSVDLGQYGIRTNNWTLCGGITGSASSQFPQVFPHSGAWPVIADDGTLNNGGVPQNVNQTLFLEMLTLNVRLKMPDPEFAGLGVFDFENWTPIWEQNLEASNWHGIRYQNYSRQLVLKDHPGWTAAQVEAQAKKEFETAGLELFVTALKHASAMRPKTLWGFYGMPQGMDTVEATQKMLPVWQTSGAMYPSIYETADTVSDAFRQQRMNRRCTVASVHNRVTSSICERTRSCWHTLIAWDHVPASS